MKLILSLTLLALVSITLNAQSRPTTAADFNGTVQYAVFETNEAFPFVYTVVTETFRGGKLVSTRTEVNERQAKGVERETHTLTRNGQTLRSYSIMVGFDKGTYCSKNGTTWTGPQDTICPGPEGVVEMMLTRPRQPESAEYSVTEKSIGGQPVKTYRKYAIYPANMPNGKKTFEERNATIDSRGFFISVTDTEGTLNPKTVTLTRKQTWDFKTKFKPVVAPK